MTAYEKSRKIIADILTERGVCIWTTAEDLADDILLAMQAKRIIPVTMVASAELFKRFHAHCRFLGNATGHGYRYYYDLAVDTMVAEGDWPTQILAKTVNIDGTDITVDIEVAESTRKANNRQLLGAYQVIVDAAESEGVPLPENTEGEERDT